MIQSVDRAVRILKALAADDSKRCGVSELAKSLGLAKGTVHGLLLTLRDQDMVEQDPETGKYQLGPALLELSNSYLDVNELRVRSLAWSELLAARCQEAVRVGTLHGNGVLVIHHVFRPDASLQILEVGAVLPLHASAIGKAVLANLPPDIRSGYLAAPLPQLTRNTITSVPSLERELDQVRERRYAIESEEAILGEAAIAAPIFSAASVIGAIGIAGPNERLGARKQQGALATHVLEAARGISREFGTGAWPRAA